ncbi:hypothetical protein [Leptospira noguchii]|uniref:hypothetical protein n=1 Tax=Leptospira noguchii TaxID=28182 RepID=UPI00031623E2
MKRFYYFLLGVLMLLFGSCASNTTSCEKNCEIQLSTCLLLSTDSQSGNRSAAVPFLCYQMCDTCKDNCRLRTSSRNGNGSNNSRGSGGNRASGTSSSNSGASNVGGDSHSIYGSDTF